MLSDLRASIYDLFGYFLPGSVALAGIALISWAAWYPPEYAGDLTFASNGVVVSAFVVAAYLLGHVLHGIGNLIPRLTRVSESVLLASQPDPGASATVPSTHQTPSRIFLDPPAPLSKALRDAIDVQLENHFRGRVKEMSALEKFGFIDEARNWAPREGDREVYIYREGFYRGMTLASALLCVGLLLRFAVAPYSCIVLDLDVTCLSRGEIAIFSLLSLCAVPAYLIRLERFARYRIERAVLLWLDALIQAKAKTS